MENKRVKFLDIARGIAIILMVAGHADNWGGISNFINLFNMMLFVFISGYLFKDKNIKTFSELIKNCLVKTKRIYIFYLFWEILNFGLRNIYIYIGFLNPQLTYGGKIIEPISSLKQIIIGIAKIIIGMGREPFCGAFWFLITLIFIILMFSSINYISNKFKGMNKKIEFIMILVCFICGVIMYYTISIPRFSPAFTLLWIYYLGNQYYKNQDKIKFNNKYIACLGFVVLIILNNFGTIGMNANNICNPIFFLTTTSAGIYLVMYISKEIEEKCKYISNILEYIGKNTLIIMALHFLAFKFLIYIQILCDKKSISYLGTLTGIDNTNIIYLLYIVVGIFIPLMLDLFYKKIKNILKERITKHCYIDK